MSETTAGLSAGGQTTEGAAPEFYWYAFAVVREKPAATDADQRALTRIGAGWQVELAGHERRDWDDLARDVLTGVLAVRPLERLVQRDDAARIYRIALLDARGLAGAVLIGPRPLATGRDWLAARLGTPLDPAERFRLLDGRPGGVERPRGETICFCCDVGSNEIADAIAAGCQTIDDVGRKTRAGTNCGRCQTRIGEILEAHI